MKHIAVAGGTDGLGRAAALDRLSKGDTVVVIGRNPVKGKEFLDAAAALGAGARAHFVAADLSSIAATRAAIAAVRARVPHLDALVLCARHYRSERLVTPEGFEYTFALFYLSRFVLGHELLDLLAAAPDPVVLNVAGPGAGADGIRWDDLGFERDYHGLRALAHGGQLNDLLGIEFARRHADTGVRYVLLHPGVVDTALSGDYDPDMAARVQAMRATAQTVDQAVAPILRVLDTPPTAPLTAIAQGTPLDVHGPAFAYPHAATRLFDETIDLLAALGATTETARTTV